MKIDDKWKLAEIYQLDGELFDLYILVYARLNSSTNSDISVEVRTIILNLYEVEE